MTVALRMSFEDCARTAAAAHRRARRTQREGPSPGPPARRASLYKGAETSRLTQDWSSTLGVADDELRWSLMRLRGRSRDLARNSPFVRSYLRLVANNMIGPCGMTLQAQVKDNSGKTNKRLNDTIEAAWHDWGKDVTIGVPMSLVRFEHQLARTIPTDGEVFVRFWRGFGNRHAFALEAIDPDLVDEMLNRPRTRTQNEIRMGVELDEFGRPVAYHVWDRAASVIAPPSDRRRERIPASEILHLYDPDRLNHSRGVPWLVTVMYPLKMFDGYVEAELVASRVAASKMGFFKRSEDATGPAVTGQEGEDGSGAIEMEANPGTFETMPPGYELQTFDAQHPAGQFPAFVKTQLRMIASGLGISYNVLANDLESVNYSSMRSGLGLERDTWRSLQHWWIGAFRDRVYREWLSMSLLAGAITLDSRDFRKFLDVRWVPRGWTGVDPIKDTQAAIAAMDRGLVAPQDVVAEEGRELEDVYRQISEADKLAKQYGIEVGRAEPSARPSPEPEKDPDEGGDREPDTARLATDVRPGNRLAALIATKAHANGKAVHQNGSER